MQIILARADHDEAILELYEKLGQVYGFVMQDDALRRIDISADPRCVSFRIVWRRQTFVSLSNKSLDLDVPLTRRPFILLQVK